MNSLAEFVPWLRLVPDESGLLLPSKSEMACFDQLTIGSGTSSLELMERAGTGVTEEILTWTHSETALSGQILILCGPGNNGGDGFVIGRLLATQGYFVQVALVNSPKYSTDLLKMAQRFLDVGGIIRAYGEEGVARELLDISLISGEQLTEAIERCSCIVDCLLGTGQESAPRGYIKEVLRRVGIAKRAESKAISVDIPTGVSGDSGKVYDDHFECDLCVTIQLVKRGLTQYPARSVFRQLAAVDIGIHCDKDCEYNFIDPIQYSSILKRAPGSHKGSQGKVLIIAGSKEMPGASVLASRACLTAGAGLVTMTRLEGVDYPDLAPELMYSFVDSEKRGFFSISDYALLSERLSWADAIVLGPGLGRRDASLDFALEVINEARTQDKPCIVDADALRVVQSSGFDRDGFHNLVLTPHPGEMAFLLECSIEEVQSDRFHAVKTLGEETGAVCVLKGAGSLVYFSGEGRANTTGNPYMASGGCGDALAGIIGAFAAKESDSLFDAASLGVFAHGLAGDIAHSEGSYSVLASSLISALPTALSQIGDEIE